MNSVAGKPMPNVTPAFNASTDVRAGKRRSLSSLILDGDTPPRSPSFLANSKALIMVIYAGHISSEAYGLTWHKRQHEPLISLKTYQKIRDRRAGVAKTPNRANIGDAFALRGIVTCACCDTPLRSYFAKGRHGRRFPYYMCSKKGCPHYGKSTKRDQLEADVGLLIKALQPTTGHMVMASAMFRTAWDMRHHHATEQRLAAGQQIKSIEKEIDGFLDRISTTQIAQVITRYEDKIAALEKQRALLAERQANQAVPAGSFDEKVKLLLRFLASPWKLWEPRSVQVRRTVLKLAFTTRITYGRFEGVRTPEISFPFNALGGIGVGSEWWSLAGSNR